MIEIQDLLKRHEGLRLKPYRDTVGKLTIGIGRNLDDVGISEDEAVHMLLNDIQKVQRQLVYRFPWYSKLDRIRQMVLEDMCFNMGLGNAQHGLLSFPNTLSLIELGNYPAAAAAMLQSHWAAQVGNRAVELSEMMRTGEFPS